MRIKARSLGVRLGGRVVFDALEFDWEAPGVVAVTGPNGSGKTTLLKVLAGLLVPGRGRIEWEDGGKALGVRDVRARLGFAGPEIGLYEDLTGAENLEFFAAATGRSWNGSESRTLLDRFGLADRGGDRVMGYSSGMKQRLKLAFAVQAEPALLLLDEPGSNLDDDGRARLVRMVAETGRQALVVVATNDPEEASWAGTRLSLPA
ncbi:MAG: ABC transporter ATP-binding protein [Candidatus Eiseniibacteriota bacterium]